MSYKPLVPAARPALDRATLDAVSLLARLMNLVSLCVVHLDSHPTAYASGCGLLLKKAIQDEARAIVGRAKDLDDPAESTL